MIDLAKLSTEKRNPRTENIDELSALEIVTLLNTEDQTVPLTVQKILPDIARAITVIAERLSEGGRLFYIGSGTSGRLGVLDAAECPPTYNTDPQLIQAIIAGGPDAVFHAHEGIEDRPEEGARDLMKRHLCDRDIVVGLTASGRTPYVLGALEYAVSRGAYTIGITCTLNPETARFSSLSLTSVTGAEAITGSTRMKAGTAQKMILNMLSTGSMILIGKVYGNLMVDLQCTNHKLEARACHIIQEVTGCNKTQAMFCLKRAHGNAKTAILMYLQDLDYDTANARLLQNGGILKKALLS